MTATYLIRFDDICPTHNWLTWRDIEDELYRRNLKPTLAVVPDNHDPKLIVNAPRADFWDCVRRWQSMGWTIGLHGYQHRYVTQQRGIVGLNARSEFAGLSEVAQEDKLQRGLTIFKREGVKADVWIAPAHAFDATTVKILSRLGIRIVSDGFHLFPYTDTDQMTWIPQQLWRFVERPFGVWTVCYHHNHWTNADLTRFRSDVARFQDRISAMSQVTAHYQHRSKSLWDTLAWRTIFASIKMRAKLGQMKLAVVNRTKH